MMKDYKIDIYKNSADNSSRFILGTKGDNPLIVLGINPSIADNTKSDITINKIKGFANHNGFDSFIVLNLYPQRATNPKTIDNRIDHKKNAQNIHTIKNLISTHEKIYLLAAWGNIILKREFLKQCLVDIYKLIRGYNINWIKIGDLTKHGHPRHPARLSYNQPLTVFDIDNYIRSFNQ